MPTNGQHHALLQLGGGGAAAGWAGTPPTCTPLAPVHMGYLIESPESPCHLADFDARGCKGYPSWDCQMAQQLSGGSNAAATAAAAAFHRLKIFEQQAALASASRSTLRAPVSAMRHPSGEGQRSTGNPCLPHVPLKLPVGCAVLVPHVGQCYAPIAVATAAAARMAVEGGMHQQSCQGNTNGLSQITSLGGMPVRPVPFQHAMVLPQQLQMQPPMPPPFSMSDRMTGSWDAVLADCSTPKSLEDFEWLATSTSMPASLMAAAGPYAGHSYDRLLACGGSGKEGASGVTSGPGVALASMDALALPVQGMDVLALQVQFPVRRSSDCSSSSSSGSSSSATDGGSDAMSHVSVRSSPACLEPWAAGRAQACPALANLRTSLMMTTTSNAPFAAPAGPTAVAAAAGYTAGNAAVAQPAPADALGSAFPGRSSGSFTSGSGQELTPELAAVLMAELEQLRVSMGIRLDINARLGSTNANACAASSPRCS
jgi:hypothetical protein